MFNYKSFNLKKLERIRQVVDRIKIEKDVLLKINWPSGNKHNELLKELEDWTAAQFIIRHILRKVPNVG